MAAQLSTFTGGSLSAPGMSVSSNFYVGESQLMNFVLSANDAGGVAAPDSMIQMTILDGSGNVVYTLTAPAGDTVSAAALFLTPRAYQVKFTALGTHVAGGPALAFVLKGNAISDPVGPVLTGPTLDPVYTVPGLPAGSSTPAVRRQSSFIISLLINI